MLRKLLLTLLIAAACAAQSQGPVYKLLYSPPVSANLGYLGTIFEAEPGLFYVLASWETNTFGPSIFTITSAGTFKSIYTFAPYTLIDTMVRDMNGALYAPAQLNGSGSLQVYYSIAPSGKNLHEYSIEPWGSGLKTIAAPQGGRYDLLGRNQGSIPAFAHIDEDGEVTILHQFSGSEGYPYVGMSLAYGADGNYYGIGTQQQYGVSPAFIFRLTPRGAYSQPLTFPKFPQQSAAFPLVSAFDGSLYGTFSREGRNGTGEIYQATLSGQFHGVASFPAEGLTDPRTLMQAADGNFYGTTNGNQIFRYNPALHHLVTLYQLDPGGAQGKCACVLIEGMDGKLYGVAPNGGNYPGVGAVFSLNIGLPKPQPVVSGLYPASGPVGQRVVLWGNYLLGATSVTFNGAPAADVVVTSVQSVHVTVPAATTTGPVTITTANGSFTTTQNFTLQ